MESYGIYFGDGTLDTIKYCSMPLTYLTPQIENKSGIITDTLKWIPITGTFVANGTEKYMVLGNFRSDQTTNTIVINPTHLPALSVDLYIDDVSLLELNAPAYAGPDRFVVPGDSVFIGSPPDIGVDEACTWFKLPNDSVAIDTVGGFYVKPAETCTYLVRQEICGVLKWDTVVIFMNPVGVAGYGLRVAGLGLYPVPASEKLFLEVQNAEWYEGYNALRITDATGRSLREERIALNDRTEIDLRELPDGIYFLSLTGGDEPMITKRFVVGK